MGLKIEERAEYFGRRQSLQARRQLPICGLLVQWPKHPKVRRGTSARDVPLLSGENGKDGGTICGIIGSRSHGRSEIRVVRYRNHFVFGQDVVSHATYSVSIALRIVASGGRPVRKVSSATSTFAGLPSIMGISRPYFAPGRSPAEIGCCSPGGCAHASPPPTPSGHRKGPGPCCRHKPDTQSRG